MTTSAPPRPTEVKVPLQSIAGTFGRARASAKNTLSRPAPSTAFVGLTCPAAHRDRSFVAITDTRFRRYFDASKAKLSFKTVTRPPPRLLRIAGPRSDAATNSSRVSFGQIARPSDRV